MNASYRYLSIAIVILAVSVLFAGCTSGPAANTGQATQAPADTNAGAPGGTNSAASAATTALSLPYGVNISVPADWTRQNVLTSGARDYGFNTVNIANFYSPDAIAGNQNSYTSLGIDVDQNPGLSFEQYFNNATLAVGNTYGSPTVTAQSITLTIGGYKTYELDFQTPQVHGSYYFTDAANTYYIFSFKSQNNDTTIQASRAEITDMVKSISLNPPTVIVTQHR
jgi:hypothetical protein